MKAFREEEGTGEAEIDGPAAVEELSPLAAIKPHSELVL